tara:strand:- start:20792 stop:21709 length:918 start_codon:yes stop_codon:yes gene_type:complete
VKYLLLTIFATNIIFYSFLLLKPNGDSFYFLIAQDNSLSDVFEILEEKEIFFPKIIKSIFVVTGTDQKIYQGNYQINKDDSVYEIFKKIYFGKIVLKKFIVSEGSQTRNLFSNELLATYCEQEKLMPCNLEGLVMPDTYFFDREEEIIEILKIATKSQEKKIDLAWQQRNKDLFKYSKYDLLIIASMLEKESCVNERNKISGVIQNRLKKNMHLQIDSTTIYGLKNFNGDLKKHHLRDSSLYNTYMHKGLPPGPISNPSFNSLMAAGQPSSHDFFYFVAKGECSHVFSTNYEDHLRAVQKYQLRK